MNISEYYIFIRCLNIIFIYVYIFICTFNIKYTLLSHIVIDCDKTIILFIIY